MKDPLVHMSIRAHYNKPWNQELKQPSNSDDVQTPCTLIYLRVSYLKVFKSHLSYSCKSDSCEVLVIRLLTALSYILIFCYFSSCVAFGSLPALIIAHESLGLHL